MNTERLVKLRDLLAKIPPSHFDLGIWIRNVDEEGKATDQLLGQCGTSACAVGWACTNKEFNKEGLTYGIDGENMGFPVYTGIDADGDEYEETGFDAVATFFDISVEMSWLLFSNDEYEIFYDEDSDEYNIGPSDVVKRIDTLLENAEQIFNSEYDLHSHDVFKGILDERGI